MSVLRFLVAICLAGALLGATGCSKSGDAVADGSTAAISGASGEAEPGAASAQSKTPVRSSRATAEDRHPIVEFETTLGKFRVQLDRAAAPETVDRFLSNARAGVYDGTIFHRVWKGYVAMGGSHTSDLKEKSSRGLALRHEGRKSPLKNVRGAISMERKPDAVDSAVNGFFVNLSDNPNLDYVDATPAKCGYCVFGKVLPEDMTVLDAIGQVEVAPKPGFEQLPKNPVEIHSARWIERP